MTTTAKIKQHVEFNQATYEWLMGATEPMAVDPRAIDTNVLVWNQCLATLRAKIEHMDKKPR